ncbi:MAG: tRNA (adenosine(37)-N6)-threonylcarbamoyltransferase complex transferase subunit TsaD [Ideonella sp.]|jgi:N6-L-threonylcarbamoyladenine synthase|nr:tRNA (adenosine(37)-N6)-threonylcarbamoyltransferase complex transferase subunit TsaD [Ideonella sp.]
MRESFMNILGIETSCDETGVAWVQAAPGGVPRLVAQALHSQVDLHESYGGVVPELASRDHIRRVLPLAQQVLRNGGGSWGDIDLIAYTAGPGLAGALLVGAGVAAGLAAGLGRPAAPVHHLEGHLLSPFLGDESPTFPFVALLVSGGHTQLLDVEGVGRYRLLGESVDDAAGEAFDKAAKLLGLGYPGGPALSSLAQAGDAARYALPRPLLHSGDLDFSFSGLKTAVLTQVRRLGAQATAQDRADLAAATQAAIVDVLVAKAAAALASTGRRELVVAGGVGANRLLRDRLVQAGARRGAQVRFPPAALCTDNGAMIALAAAMRWQRGLLANDSTGSFSVRPRWPLEEASAALP